MIYIWNVGEALARCLDPPLEKSFEALQVPDHLSDEECLYLLHESGSYFHNKAVMRGADILLYHNYHVTPDAMKVLEPHLMHLRFCLDRITGTITFL